MDHTAWSTAPRALPGEADSLKPLRADRAAFSPPPRRLKRPAARIQAVITTSDYRRRGYAKAALAVLLAHLERDGVMHHERHASDMITATVLRPDPLAASAAGFAL